MNTNISVTKLAFINIVDLNKMVKCDDNRKILDELTDITTVKPIEGKHPLSISVLLQNKFSFKK